MNQAPPAPADPLKAPLWQQTLQQSVLEATRYFTHDEIREHVEVALAANAQPSHG